MSVNPRGDAEDGEPPEEQATFELHGEDPRILEVGGELDKVTAADFEHAVRQGLKGTPAVLVVDLTRVDFLGTPGLRVLFLAAGAAGRTALRVVSNPVISRTLRAVDLSSKVPVFSSLEEALAE
ncbi:anti-anti-sigma factor [Amycolatopsis bartoniae]|uniref:STAS domain-containing protein n=1 Tax=Amycolatopsis bartoniae TaxID=941986 RepID=A0A8H9IZB4_9PSEU|nr:STAS domain-containing protein [Amycolatopsis bartoniae]MBB2936825.1 anti-anti-sigma factor [Amycolatopsis bartoniae]GHF50410.1 hypothetical protein GCM10017566_24410 [Amycolatopsis bartoniae]